jgi:2-polyprenyl-3-methyl-5-hydroxy-6-metoxy-1,4-benzoquinol methylase
MLLDDDVFEQALTLFHHYSLQNDEAVRQMHDKGILPTAHRIAFSVLDIGAGQGCLPGLMQQYADTLVLLEPNPRCVQVLQQQFDPVYPYPWGNFALHRLRSDYPKGFDLITMSHMIYHFHGIDDIRKKIRMALTLLKPEGHLAIIINQPSAPTARIGIAFQLAEDRFDEAATNQDLHTFCHESHFYRELSGGHGDVAVYPVNSPISQVKSREDMITLFRMPLLNPLSKSPCDTDRLDSFISHYLDSTYPSLAYPATIPSYDDLIIIRKVSA